MKKKLLKGSSSKKGFTITEMLAAVAVLAVLCSAIGTGIAAATNSYQKSVETSESYVLLDTLTQAIKNELQYSRDFKEDSYTSAVYGGNAQLKIDEKGYVVVVKGENSYLLIGEKSYTSGLYAEISIAYGKKSTVDISILNQNGEKICHGEFSVSSFNG